MDIIIDNLSGFWSFLILTVKSIGVADIIDITLVSVIFYLVYKFIRDRRAGKLAAGVVILVLLQIISNLLNLSAMRFLMQNIFQIGLLALVVVFQPELRSALEKMGGEPLKSLMSIGESKDSTALSASIKEVCDAVSDLSSDHTGALIVIERTTKLGDVIKSGIVINADISSFLLKNIFFNKAPLHDGAVIIRNMRILAAGCFLPLSPNESIVKDLGTRHRAGIGISENSDAIVIIVSEETGMVSVASEGELKRGYNYNTLRQRLESELSGTAAVKLVSSMIPHKKKGTDDIKCD